MNQDTSTTETQTAAQAVERTPEGGLASPFCRELRSKKFYFLQEMPTEIHHLRDGSNYCWCRLTMRGLGPDGELARPEDCKSGRSCYKSLFAE